MRKHSYHEMSGKFVDRVELKPSSALNIKDNKEYYSVSQCQVIRFLTCCILINDFTPTTCTSNKSSKMYMDFTPLYVNLHRANGIQDSLTAIGRMKTNPTIMPNLYIAIPINSITESAQ